MSVFDPKWPVKCSSYSVKGGDLIGKTKLIN